MKRISAFAMAVVGTALAAAPAAFAQSDVVVNLMAPPFANPAAPSAMNEQQALTALHGRGLRGVAHLGKVGDYWEGEGLLRGRPVLAYLYGNGAIELQRVSPGALRQASNILPLVRG